MKRVSAEEAQRITEHLRLYSEPGIIGDLASTVVALEADLAALRIEHEAHAALLTAARRDRDDARAMLRDAQEELHLTALAIYGKDADAHMLHEAAGDVVADRDRLRDILACERGEKAPGGWEWEWQTRRWINASLPAVVCAGRWFIGIDGPSGTARYLLESIEAADLAAKATP